MSQLLDFQMALSSLDAPPPAPWGGDPREPQDREPLPEENRPPVQEPWTGPVQPVREPGDHTPHRRFH